jgi:hypothetical protein
MNDLQLELEWDRVDGSRGGELAATFARFSIRIDGKTISEVFDHRSRSVRQHLFVPLYPLAEWLASHWWSLLYEAEAPNRNDYELRHNLRFGREGYAFPDLLIRPLGERASIEWRALDLPDAGISFSGNGSRLLDLANVRQELSDLIDTVIARLDQQGVTDTFLHQEWRNIQCADEEEAAFCEAAARLGQDPYALDDPVAEAIIASAQVLPMQWQEDFFAIADARHLTEQASLVSNARELAQGNAERFATLVELRERTPKIDSKSAPWEQGYEAARKLRDQMGLDGTPLNSDEMIANAFGIRSLEGITLDDATARKLFDALVDSQVDTPPSFLTTKQRPEQIRFAFCRALFEYLTAPEIPSALVTLARTDRQKRNRAFAAELLAPASWLRNRISGTWVRSEEVDEWADELGVSTAVIEHQIENHRLAEVVDD